MHRVNDRGERRISAPDLPRHRRDGFPRYAAPGLNARGLGKSLVRIHAPRWASSSVADALSSGPTHTVIACLGHRTTTGARSATSSTSGGTPSAYTKIPRTLRLPASMRSTHDSSPATCSPEQPL